MAKLTIEQLLKDVSVTTKVAEESMSEKKEEKKEEKAEEKKEEKAEEKKEEKKASPMEDVMKIAEKLAHQEKEAMVKEAEMIGMAIIDGAMARVAQYEKVASQNEAVDMEKVASAYNSNEEFRASFDAGVQDAALEKIAHEIESDPEAKLAFEQGYKDGVESLVKIGSFLQDKAYVETARAIQNTLAEVK